MLTIKHLFTGVAASALILAAGSLPVLDQAFGIAAASAQNNEEDKAPKGKKVDSLRATVYEKIAKIQEKMELPDAKEKAAALTELRGMIGDKLNDYETAVVYQILGQDAIEREDYKTAIAEFNKIVGLERVPESIRTTSLNALAQLYLVIEDYKKSIEYMNRWLATQENPGPSSYYFLAQAYYGLEDYKNIIPNAEKAIQLSREQGIEVKENYFLLLRAAYFELGNFKKVAEILETLAVNYDKGEYWRQLGGVYSELKEEAKQFAAMEVAYRRGFMDTESNLVNMAQIYLYNNVPIKAAWVLEKAMKDGIVEKNAEHYELLGQSYLAAQEMQKAEKPLEIAAKAADDGEIWLRLGQVYTELEEWEKAKEPLKKAAASDDIEKLGFPNLLLGMAYFYTNDFDEAKRYLAKARTFDETEKTARQWSSYVDDEVKRRKQLTAYYGGGQ